MNIQSKLNQIYSNAKSNRWHWYFYIFCRISLSLGFIIAGIVKIRGERFASGLSVNHLMGQYLEALFHTGFYYTFIGITQVAAAILLLIPRTVTVEALLYFPIIVNICILTFAVRFDGSLISAPLMLLANLYILCWNYDKIKFIFPFKNSAIRSAIPKEKKRSNMFPKKFFAVVVVMVIMVVFVTTNMYDIVPKNRLSECKEQFKETNRIIAGNNFCKCIHIHGESLNKCLDKYENAPDDTVRKD